MRWENRFAKGIKLFINATWINVQCLGRFFFCDLVLFRERVHRIWIRYSIVNIIIEDFIVVEKHGYSVRRHLSKVNRIHGGALFSQRTTTHKENRHRYVLLSLSVFASDSVRILAASLIIHFDKSIIISQTASLRKLSHLYYVSYHFQVYFVFRIIFSSLHYVCIIGLLEHDFHIFFYFVVFSNDKRYNRSLSRRR